MGKCSELCKRIKKTCCCTKKGPTANPPGNPPQEQNDQDSNVNVRLCPPPPLEIQIKEKRRDQSLFVCKTFIVKQCQFAILCGYFFFILFLDATYQKAIFWWLGMPAAVYVFVFFFVRIKKNPPHFSTMIIFMLLSSFSFSFLVGWIFVQFRYHVIFLPASVLFVYVSYLIMIPLFFTQKMYMDMSIRKYHLIPLWIVWIENLILIAVTAAIPLDPKFGMVNKFDMLCIFCIPTVFWSTVFMWFSMLQLRQMLQGEWFYLIYDDFVHDYLYASLYLI